MLELVLMHVADRDLLKCRFVSRRWRANASSACRRRHFILRLRQLFLPGIWERMFLTFQHELTDIPWSACTLTLLKEEPEKLNYGDSFPISQVKRFTREFGHHMRKLTIYGNHEEAIMSILRGMPNLERLESPLWQKVFYENHKTHLSRLKALKVSFYGDRELDFIESVVRNAPHLKYIYVTIQILRPESWSDGSYTERARRLASLIAYVPFIHLIYGTTSPCYGTSVNMFSALTVKGFKLRVLNLKMPSPIDKDLGFYHPLEAFLVHVAEYLEKLTLTDDQINNKRYVARLQIPTLSKLKILNLRQFQPCDSQFTILREFSTNQFPVLEEIMVDRSCKKRFMDAFNSASFPSVRKLKVDNAGHFPNYGLKYISNLSRSFPNLREFEVKGARNEDVMGICMHIRNLEHLHLQFTREDNDDPNSSITTFYSGLKCALPITGRN